MRKLPFTFLLLFSLTLLFPLRAYAAEEPAFVNDETGYTVYLLDEADLLSEAEEEALVTRMREVTAYGGAAFVSARSGSAEGYYRRFFDNTSGTLLMINMGTRTIELFSDGQVYGTITSAKALSITDNVYSYASAGDYFACADEAFAQVVTLLAGGRIAEPMKYLSNAFLALILAAILNYLIVRALAARYKPDNRELINAMDISYEQKDASVSRQGSQRKYSPSAAIITARVALAILKAAASSGGGSSSGGRSSGGSSSGGGGSHRF